MLVIPVTPEILKEQFKAYDRDVHSMAYYEAIVYYYDMGPCSDYNEELNVIALDCCIQELRINDLDDLYRFCDDYELDEVNTIIEAVDKFNELDMGYAIDIPNGIVIFE